MNSNILGIKMCGITTGYEEFKLAVHAKQSNNAI
jgi:hypothetical protein